MPENDPLTCKNPSLQLKLKETSGCVFLWFDCDQLTKRFDSKREFNLKEKRTYIKKKINVKRV